MARPKQISANPAPGAGTVFALRAIGLVLAAQWVFSMSQIGYLSSLRGMTLFPWACVNVVLIFLLMTLPGAERPLHAADLVAAALRLASLLMFAFAVFAVSTFVWASGWRRFVNALAETNGWLLIGPALYAIVMWICRPRALWRTNIAPRRFSIGRYAISLDPVTCLAVVWAESRKLGQYDDARELSVKWPEPPADVPSTHMLAPATDPPRHRSARTALRDAACSRGVPRSNCSGIRRRRGTITRRCFARRFRASAIATRPRRSTRCCARSERSRCTVHVFPVACRISEARVLISWLLAAIHLLAFGFALGAVLGRARALRRLDVTQSVQANQLPAPARCVSLSDSVWGITAIVLIVTGVTRAFGGFEKGGSTICTSRLFT